MTDSTCGQSPRLDTPAGYSWVDGSYSGVLPPDRKEVRHVASKSTKIGREAGSGRFITVKKAQANPKTTTVETLPKPKGK